MFLVEFTGAMMMRQFSSLIATLDCFINALRSVYAVRGLQSRVNASEFLRQIYFSAVEAFLMISLIAFGLGFLTALQSGSEGTLLGSPTAFSRLLFEILVRDLGPLLIALLLIARSGTAVSSELGSMQANKEIDALRIMCLDPYSFLVFPRIAAGATSALSLGLFFTAFAILGSSAGSFAFGGPQASRIISQALEGWSPIYLLTLIGKYFFSGLLVFTVACQLGLSVRRGAFEVPQVTSKSVLRSLAYVLAFQLLITLMTTRALERLL